MINDVAKMASLMRVDTPLTRSTTKKIKTRKKSVYMILKRNKNSYGFSNNFFAKSIL